MKYQPDSSVPEILAIRQAIADQNSTPRADKPLVKKCMTDEDLFREYAQAGQGIPVVFSRI